MLKLKTGSNTGSDTLTCDPTRPSQNRWPGDPWVTRRPGSVSVDLHCVVLTWSIVGFSRAIFRFPVIFVCMGFCSSGTLRTPFCFILIRFRSDGPKSWIAAFQQTNYLGKQYRVRWGGKHRMEDKGPFPTSVWRIPCRCLCTHGHVVPPFTAERIISSENCRKRGKEVLAGCARWKPNSQPWTKVILERKDQYFYWLRSLHGVLAVSQKSW